MNLFRTFIKRPVTTTMIVVVMVVMGLYSYSHLVTELLPRINFPIVVVTTVYPGAAPAEIETQVTKKIEDEVATLANIEELTSDSMENMSQITVQFALEVDQDQASIDVKDKVDAIAADLPEDAEDPVITKFDLAGGAAIELAVTGSRPLNEIYEIVDKQIAERLSRVDGVAEVEIIGQQDREIQVAVEPARLRAYDLTLLDVLQVLSAGNLNVPVGNITRGAGETTVRMKGEVRTPEELGSFRLNLPAGGSVPLSEVAEIVDTTEEIREAASFNGKPAIGVAVKKRSDGNTVAVVEGVQAALADLEGILGDDIQISEVQESATFVRDSVADVLSNMGIGILLTGVLLFIFLHDWRTTLIAAVAMPVAVIAAFMLMEQGGFTVNVMSLMALGISIGTLVTNSIVVLENISRHMTEGADPDEAAATGTAEVTVAVLASTLTNIVVFTPIAFMSGIVGKFFLQFGMTVVFATIFSLVVSFTMVPMLAAKLMRPGKGIGHGDNIVARGARAWDRFYENLEAGYRDVLAFCLRRRWIPLSITVVLFVGGLSLLGYVGGEFVPVADQGMVQVSLEFPAGTSLERTMGQAEKVAAHLRDDPVVQGVQVKVGGETRGVEDADLLIRLLDKWDREESIDDYMNRIRPHLALIPDALVSLYILGEASGVEADLLLEVTGYEAEAVETVGGQVYDIVHGVPGMVEVQTSDRAGKPEINILPRRRHLSEQGLVASQMGGILRAAYEGEEAGVYRESGEEYDVVVKFAEEDRRDPAYLPDLPVATPLGSTVPLSEVGEIVTGIGDPTIKHSEKIRLVEITGNIGDGTLSEKRREIDEQIAAIELPAGVFINYGGNAEHQDESFQAIIEALILAIILIYIVMAGILESFIHPFTVMATLPLSLIGMAVALFFSGETINIMSLMALVMMIGIVVNNAILLLDYTAQMRAKGMGITQALLEACPNRLRPIIMANLAIAIAMVPQIMGGGGGSEYRSPMAVVQIGGVLVATVFTLFVVPVVYTLFDRLTPAGRREAKV
ncbi:MAG: efflux RND transporter permease subunit [bacterium]|nr:efflux RND transporter permease subunit [bacterium]